MYVERTPIDPALALRQHAAWVDALRAAGCSVAVLPPIDDLPDAVFVEDTAVVLPEVTVLCRPGDPARRPEVEAIEEALRRGMRQEDGAGRPDVAGPTAAAAPGRVVRVEAPATLEGGDVLRLGRRLHVGRITRTNDAGIAALADAAGPFGWEVIPVDVAGALHLKTACTALDDATVLIDPARVDPAVFVARPPDAPPLRVLEIHPDEPAAANVFRAPRAIVMGASGPRTAAAIEAAGFAVIRVDLSEFEKAEGGPTCLSLVVAWSR